MGIKCNLMREYMNLLYYNKNFLTAYTLMSATKKFELNRFYLNVVISLLDGSFLDTLLQQNLGD